MKKNKKTEISLQDLENDVIMNEAIFEKKKEKMRLDNYFNIKITKKNEMVY